MSNGTYHALMSIEFGPISQSYTSEVEINHQALTVSATAIDGPFSHLNSYWTFTPGEQATKVDFRVDFKFANPLLSAIAEPAFAAKQEEIIDAFIAEAKRRYS